MKRFLQLINTNNIKLLLHSFQNESFKISVEKVINKFYRIKSDNDYQVAVKKGTLSLNDINSLDLKIKDFKIKPFFSIITPVFNTEPQHLEACISSTKNQVYTFWEHILIDDASTNIQSINNFNKLKLANEKKFVFLNQKENGGISIASNIGIENAKGNFIVFLDHDDELSPLALYHLAETINNNKSVSLLYTNEDILDQNNKRVEPSDKNKFDINLLRKQNYINHLLAVSKDAGDKVGWFRSKFDYAQDYDLILRIIDTVPHNEILFNSNICYHWRKSVGSISHSPNNKSDIHQKALHALQEHLSRNSDNRKVKFGRRFGTFEIYK